MVGRPSPGGWKFYERIVMKSAKKHKGGFWINLDPETLKEIEKSAKANCRSMRQEITFIIKNFVTRENCK